MATAPNTTISLPGGKIVINEQVPVPGGLKVSGAHITLPGVDLAVSSVNSIIHNCWPTPKGPRIRGPFGKFGRVGQA